MLRSTNTLFCASMLDANTVCPLTGETVMAYQNCVGVTPADFFQVVPPSVVTDSEDFPLLRSQTRMCEPLFVDDDRTGPRKRPRLLRYVLTAVGRLEDSLRSAESGPGVRTRRQVHREGILGSKAMGVVMMRLGEICR